MRKTKKLRKCNYFQFTEAQTAKGHNPCLAAKIELHCQMRQRRKFAVWCPIYSPCIYKIIYKMMLCTFLFSSMCIHGKEVFIKMNLTKLPKSAISVVVFRNEGLWVIHKFYFILCYCSVKVQYHNV